ncbi:thiol-disulfide oxidoreductase DCC family protein [Paenibacillus filicis]|uniref:Thiol-disulfide oxidoreductase DCC family protein n=1 Tax=Paenibacillus gyeongsangnamensis TaxID=3388067 RepID=A0ABT4Q7L3_9BACL|nr:thiol-disulfide oxidoreductase DCC family protein [Paenibacillus filicis]MCZ8512782.1 thiol-disulfide oxidoreductase DCC family protein [Paenibacillus filicis]
MTSDDKNILRDATAEEAAIVFYDGTCGLCNRVVQFIIPRDPRGRFRFAALQSEIGKKMLRERGMDPEAPDTFVLLEGDRLYTRSTAGLHVLRRLGGAWPLTYALILVPRPFRDGMYNLIARSRYRWFGRSDACMLPDRSVRQRFIED